MNYRPTELVSKLTTALANFDTAECTTLCTDFIAWLYQSDDDFPAADAAELMQKLRNKRQFALMVQLGDALIQSGRGTYRIRRQYAQALLDQGMLTAAMAVLSDLIRDIENADGQTSPVMRAKENAEAWGLLGRVHKQMYVTADGARNGHIRQHLWLAIKAYSDMYNADPSLHSWHGINVVAMVLRAERDGEVLPERIDVVHLATSILRLVETKFEEEVATMWDFAIAAEACLALGEPRAALQWTERYVSAPNTDAFEVASTLRQLTEVWQLDQATGDEKLLLPILQAKLLQQAGGRLDIALATLQQQQAEEAETSAVYQKVFGLESYSTYQWYQLGADRCLAVARIGYGPSRGEGTGFLVRGEDLHPTLTGEVLLLTNAHVLAHDDNTFRAMRVDEACITFELLGQNDTFKAGKVLWSSPPDVLDTSIVQFAPEDHARVQELLQKIDPYPLAKSLPIAHDTPQRVYIIGHPAGGTLSLSLQDNLLLDHQEPLIHYRTPTVGGSSGSPVFNQLWQLIGIHHKGGMMPKLNGQQGTYEANEGLWIQAIRTALAEFLLAPSPTSLNHCQ